MRCLLGFFWSFFVNSSRSSIEGKSFKNCCRISIWSSFRGSWRSSFSNCSRCCIWLSSDKLQQRSTRQFFHKLVQKYCDSFSFRYLKFLGIRFRNSSRAAGISPGNPAGVFRQFLLEVVQSFS